MFIRWRYLHTILYRDVTWGRLRTTAARRFSAYNVVESVATTTTSSWLFCVECGHTVLPCSHVIIALVDSVRRAVTVYNCLLFWWHTEPNRISLWTAMLMSTYTLICCFIITGKKLDVSVSYVNYIIILLIHHLFKQNEQTFKKSKSV